jgi:exodeoxyribonuclease VII small subunit
MAEQSFEKALAELESIVAKMEKGGLPLNESLSLFEKGVKLARFLRDELEKAEKKTEILLKDEQGQIKAEPFDLTQEEEGAEETVGEDDESPESGENNDLPF